MLKDRAPQIAEAISRETGKALWETQTELTAMQGKVDISIRAYDERTGERTADTAFGSATLRHRPHGVAAVLGPFNFPGHLPTAILSRPCWPAIRSFSSLQRRHL